MASKYTTIHVTQEDVDKALRRNSARCVLATAVARSIPGASKVAVDLQALRFTLDGERHVYFTPPAAVGYVIAFDAGDAIHPFSFRLSEKHRLPSFEARTRTPSGRTREAARERVRTAERAVGRTRERVEQASTDAEREVAAVKLDAQRERVETLRGELAETLAATSGEPERVHPLRRNTPPTTFKRGTRHYGHRELRINGADVDQDARANVKAEYERYA